MEIHDYLRTLKNPFKILALSKELNIKSNYLKFLEKYIIYDSPKKNSFCLFI